MIRFQGTADLHMHTSYSDGRPTVKRLLEHVANHTSLQVIAVTDHNTIDGALEARALAAGYPFEVIVGEEVSSRGGHILALYIEHCVPAGLSAAETIDAIHQLGGLAIAAHPFITTNTIGKQEVTMEGVGTLIATLPFDGIEVDNSTPFLEWANYRARRLNRRARRLPEIGNSDAHIVEAIGKSFTRFPGRTAAELRQAIEQGRTIAQGARYSVPELLEYGRFWLQTTWGRDSRKPRTEEQAVLAGR